MFALAISILWLLIGVIVLLGVVWLSLYVVKMFIDLPANIEKAIWAIVLILCLIGALTLLAGGGGNLRSPFPRQSSGPITIVSASPATYL